MRNFAQHFWFSSLASIVAVVASLIWLGPASLLPLLVLAIIEITFSFDNAVVNAKVLGRMSHFWQQLFLSLGIIVAIFGMRLLFPVLMVALTAHLPWHEVIRLALHHPHEYARHLEVAKPAITGFGGAFLAMLGLHFFMDKDRPEHWLGWFERPLQRVGRVWLPTIVVAIVVLVLSWLPATHHGRTVLTAGLLGIGSYLAVFSLTYLIDRVMAPVEGPTGRREYVGWAAVAMFAYLEVLDASFSFDGVLGAFAITSKVVLIVIGLGIGAVWVRSLTVFMVKQGTLQAYRYLEHGAHYAIGVLALAMLLDSTYAAPQALPGIIGLVFIVSAVLSSRRIKTKS
jgi:hypothetical protein